MKHEDFETMLPTQEDKERIISRISQDISWDQDDLIDSELDVFNTELDFNEEES